MIIDKIFTQIKFLIALFGLPVSPEWYWPNVGICTYIQTPPVAHFSVLSFGVYSSDLREAECVEVLTDERLLIMSCTFISTECASWLGN